MAETKYTPVYDGYRPVAGLPTSGHNYNKAYSALRAATSQRRDLFSGSNKSDFAKLGIKEGYSFTGGPGKVLEDTIAYDSYGSGGILKIYKDAAPAQMVEPEPTPPPVEDDPPTFIPTELPGTVNDVAPSSPSSPSSPVSTGQQAENMFASQIASMQQMFQQSIQQQQQQYMQMQAEQNKRMTELQQQMQQAMVAQQQRPQVAGVKMASGSAGTPMQIARRGVSGAFGRRGIRISGLNIR